MMNIPPNEVRATPISITGFEKDISFRRASQTKAFGLTLSVREPHLVLAYWEGGGEDGGCREGMAGAPVLW